MNNTAIERDIIAGMLADPENHAEGVRELSPDDFNSLEYKLNFELAKKKYEAGETFDPVTTGLTVAGESSTIPQSFRSLVKTLKRNVLTERLSTRAYLLKLNGHTTGDVSEIENLLAKLKALDDKRKSVPLYQRVEQVTALLEGPEPPLEWDIEGAWPSHSRGFFVGDPGVGKTWAVLGMMISYATGRPCFGKLVVRKKGVVILFTEESSRKNLHRRFSKLARGQGLKEIDLKNIYFITQTLSRVPQDEAKIIQAIQHVGATWAVFDSFRCFHNAGENDSDKILPVLDSFERIKAATDTSILLIHHLRKGGGQDKGSVFERMRGSGALWGWRDNILGIEGTDDPETGQCVTQFRDAETTPAFTLRRIYDKANDSMRLEAISLEEGDEFKSRVDQIAQIMRAESFPMSKDAVYNKLDPKGRKQTFQRIWASLEKAGSVKKDGPKWVWVGE